MAEQKAESVIKSFANVQFANMEDKYVIKMEFDGNLNTISLQFMNKTNINTYSQIFEKQNIDTITARCQLSAQDLSQVIIEHFSSIDLLNKSCRIFLFTDSKQATAKCTEFMTLNTVPDASGIIEGDEGKLDEMDKNETKQKMCLLFVVHFAPSKYVHCNFCFVIPEKHLSDTDRFMIKFNEIKSENEQLKTKLDTTTNQLTQSLNQANDKINTLSQRLQQLENESKMEEIDLNLGNGWVNYGGSFEVAKASKIGNIVYLKGLVKAGNANTAIATLPEGWRPLKYRIFGLAQDNNQACRVNVGTNGGVTINGNYTSWVSLDGIQFVTN